MQSSRHWCLSPSGPGRGQQGIRRGGKSHAHSHEAVELPKWAQSLTQNVQVAEVEPSSVESTLPNGIDLIVETETLTPTITISGEYATRLLWRFRREKKASHHTRRLVSYGQTTLDRLAFQKALDDIAANESAGEGFELQVLKPFLDRGLQLLAETN